MTKIQKILSTCIALIAFALIVAPGALHADFLEEGSVVSSVLDSGSSWVSLVWEEDLPAGTDIIFHVRSAAAEEDVEGEDWGASFTDPAGIDLSAHEQYLQFRATLSTSDVSETPVLVSIVLTTAEDFYRSDGEIESTTISPESLEAWDELIFDSLAPEDTEFFVRVLGYNESDEEWQPLTMTGDVLARDDFDDNNIDNVDDGTTLALAFGWGTTFTSVVEADGILTMSAPVIDSEEDSTFRVFPSITLDEGISDTVVLVRARVRVNTTSFGGESTAPDLEFNGIEMFTGEAEANSADTILLNEWVVLEFPEDVEQIDSIGFQVPFRYYDYDEDDWAFLENPEFEIDWIEVVESFDSYFYESPVDLSSIDVEEYPELRLYASLQTDDLSVSPELRSWDVSWDTGEGEEEEPGDDEEEEDEDEEESSGGGGGGSSHRRPDSSAGNMRDPIVLLMTQLVELLQQLLEQLLAEQANQ